MKKMGITQRVESVSSYAEKRDCLDQRWSDFSLELGFIPVPLPNILPGVAAQLVESLALDAILLSGGNNLSLLGPNISNVAPERDAFEEALIGIAIHKKIPILGICRGMQMLNCYFDGSLALLDGHVANDHVIIPCFPGLDLPILVNSYHSWGIPLDRLGNHLIPLALDENSNVEAFRHEMYPIMALMWHPERVVGFDLTELEFIRNHLL
jgi:gamma-glutamyl-gamma-aminobutyrate hydrolase PuuD